MSADAATALVKALIAIGQSEQSETEQLMHAAALVEKFRERVFGGAAFGAANDHAPGELFSEAARALYVERNNLSHQVATAEILEFAWWRLIGVDPAYDQPSLAGNCIAV